MTQEAYRASFDALRASPEFRESCKARLQSAAAERETNMHIYRSKKTMIAAVAAVCALVLSVSAAVLWLSPAQLARELKNDLLAEAFESADAVSMDETQRAGKYDVTLMGLVSGAGLGRISETLGAEKTYVALRVERADGKPLEEHPAELAFTPLVAGYPVYLVNAWTLGGSYETFAEDGAAYFLFSTESVEIFADHQVYFAVYEGMAPSNDQFVNDGESIAYAPGQTGALFALPLDPERADPAVADAMVAAMWSEK